MGKLWNQMRRSFERAYGDCDVTRQTLSLGTRDSETGWRAKSYSNSTIHMMILHSGMTLSELPPGTFPRSDALGVTDTAVERGDRVYTSGSVYFEVENVIPRYSTPDTIEYYEADLTELPLEA